jgi:hypothetical protein
MKKAWLKGFQLSWDSRKTGAGISKNHWGSTLMIWIQTCNANLPQCLTPGEKFIQDQKHTKNGCWTYVYICWKGETWLLKYCAKRSKLAVHFSLQGHPSISCSPIIDWSHGLDDPQYHLFSYFHCHLLLWLTLFTGALCQALQSGWRN